MKTFLNTTLLALLLAVGFVGGIKAEEYSVLLERDGFSVMIYYHGSVTDIDIEYINYTSDDILENVISDINSNRGVTINFGVYSGRSRSRGGSSDDHIEDALLAGVVSQEEPTLKVLFISETMSKTLEDSLARQRSSYSSLQGDEFATLAIWTRFGNADGLAWLAQKNLDTFCSLVSDAEKLEGIGWKNRELGGKSTRQVIGTTGFEDCE
ncbi:MAG: hypothetical protein VYD92_00450 [Pseudomonadota bacterium]|nr:hypothetical protein [Pseudomonadota bacterium]